MKRPKRLLQVYSSYLERHIYLGIFLVFNLHQLSCSRAQYQTSPWCSWVCWTGQVIIWLHPISELLTTRNLGPPVPAGFLLQQNALDYFPNIAWEMWPASVILEMPMGVKFYSLTETEQVFALIIYHVFWLVQVQSPTWVQWGWLFVICTSSLVSY